MGKNVFSDKLLENRVAEDELSLQKMQVVGWTVLVIMTVVSALLMSLQFAGSVFIGGVISMVSFWLSYKGVIRLVDSVTSTPLPEAKKESARLGQKGYLIKFWIRLAIIGVVLLLIIKSGMVNIFGLILGLSTVVVTITCMSMNVVYHYYFSGRR